MKILFNCAIDVFYQAVPCSDIIRFDFSLIGKPLALGGIMITRCASLSRPNQSLRLVGIFIMGVIVASYPGGSALAKPPEDLSKNIEIIQRQKSSAEGLAQMLKKAYDKKEISNFDLQKGEMLYLEAKSAFDGWIRKLQFNLKRRGPVELSQEDNKSIEEAVKKSETFKNYVRQSLPGSRGGPVVVVAIATLIKPVTEAIIKILQEFKKGDRQERERIIQQLGELQWKSFNEIR